MDLKLGDVVILKSGGQPMTVARVEGTAVTCVWMGDEGDLFREVLPLAVLDPIEQWALDEDEDEDDGDESDDSDDEDEDDKVKDKGRARK